MDAEVQEKIDGYLEKYPGQVESITTISLNLGCEDGEDCGESSDDEDCDCMEDDCDCDEVSATARSQHVHESSFAIIQIRTICYRKKRL